MVNFHSFVTCHAIVVCYLSDSCHKNTREKGGIHKQSKKKSWTKMEANRPEQKVQSNNSFICHLSGDCRSLFICQSSLWFVIFTFDAHALLFHEQFDETKIRLLFVVGVVAETQIYRSSHFGYASTIATVRVILNIEHFDWSSFHGNVFTLK